eukprot:snap_masked-scaffold_2-processed-gene-11.0-mRNA-1 protein AED:1.00 eAED:1.00 QI:0/0/0/0/1/1/2/0/364
MCLTISGEKEPVEKLCGAFGKCVENICVCDSGWVRSIDISSNVYSNSGAKDVFDSLERNRSKVSLNEFLTEISLSAPCTKNIPLLTGIYSLTVISVFLVTFIMLKVQKKKHKSKYLQTLKFINLGVTAYWSIDRLFERETIFPFSFKNSLAVGIDSMLVMMVFYFFFVKHANYNLQKAKALYSLRATLWGINLETLFIYQKRFSFFLYVIGFGGSFLISPLIVGFYRHQDSISFEVFNLLRTFQEIQNFLGLLSVLYLLVFSQIVTKTLFTDLSKLLDVQTITTNPVYQTDSHIKEDMENKKKNSVIKLMSQITYTNIIMSLWCSNAAIVFFVFILFPETDVSMQYLGPMQTGVLFPWLCLILY